MRGYWPRCARWCCLRCNGMDRSRHGSSTTRVSPNRGSIRSARSTSIAGPAYGLTSQEVVAKLEAAGYSQICKMKSGKIITYKAVRAGKEVSLVVDSFGKSKSCRRNRSVLAERAKVAREGLPSSGRKKLRRLAGQHVHAAPPPCDPRRSRRLALPEASSKHARSKPRATAQARIPIRVLQLLNPPAARPAPSSAPNTMRHDSLRQLDLKQLTQLSRPRTPLKTGLYRPSGISLRQYVCVMKDCVKLVA
jgi:hypothetical protein